jgi:hypothetical protein
MTSQFPAHGAGTSSQIQRLAVPDDPDQIDIPMTEDLFEGARPHPRTGQNPDPLLPFGFDCQAGVDDHCNVDRSRLF